MFVWNRCLPRKLLSPVDQSYSFLFRLDPLHTGYRRSGIKPEPRTAKRGQLEDVAASPNDPMFILHHLAIDCMFQEWQQTHPDGYYPSSPLQNPGHKIGDYLVPFFPLYTQGDMFVPASDFGVSCNLPNVTASATTFSHLGLWIMFSFTVLVMLF